MNPVSITVRAVQGGWTVETVLLPAPLMFLSGARAERQAHRLAQAAARLGRDVQVAIHDKMNALVALIELRGPDGSTTPPRGAPADAQHPGRRRPGGRTTAPFGSVNLREAIAQARRANFELLPA